MDFSLENFLCQGRYFEWPLLVTIDPYVPFCSRDGQGWWCPWQGGWALLSVAGGERNSDKDAAEYKSDLFHSCYMTNIVGAIEAMTEGCAQANFEVVRFPAQTTTADASGYLLIDPAKMSAADFYQFAAALCTNLDEMIAKARGVRLSNGYPVPSSRLDALGKLSGVVRGGKREFFSPDGLRSIVVLPSGYLLRVSYRKPGGRRSGSGVGEVAYAEGDLNRILLWRSYWEKRDTLKEYADRNGVKLSDAYLLQPKP